jgi:membrane dipeptidase
VRVAGEEHVAIGSDLAGAITQPEGADGAATWPALAVLLRARGWSEARIAAVLHGNAERVLSWSAAHGCARDVRRR